MEPWIVLESRVQKNLQPETAFPVAFPMNESLELMAWKMLIPLEGERPFSALL